MGVIQTVPERENDLGSEFRLQAVPPYPDRLPT